MDYIKKTFYSLVRFLREVKIEMKRVNWPSKKEILNYTIVVIAISVAVGVYLGGLDIFFQWILGRYVI
ncbi:MAG: preprotein translocase subunit SecE [Candidatus Spechtbacterales bacterium]|nr:preprotein translocase subunit SecE [Candidatus Spechtbacterales bacterium]